MKKFHYIILAFLLSYPFASPGQNRSIAFTEKPFSELLALARSQDKLIFLDAYTTWCGPCKWMAANMFTRDSVADYYNSTFICAHFDMEKGEGIELAKKYKVRAYPTLLFINGSGDMVHLGVGAPQRVSEYLELGKTAMTPGAGFGAMIKEYQEGNRDPEFIKKYLYGLLVAYMPVDEPLGQYFATQKDAELTNRTNWDMIRGFVTNMDSRAFNYLVANRGKYAKLYTKDSVYTKIFSVYADALNTASRSRSFNESAYDELKKKIRESGFEWNDKVFFVSDLNISEMKGETEKYLKLASEGIDRYYSKDYAMLNRVAWNFFQMTTDKTYLEMAARWAKKSFELYELPENIDTYANLMFKLGNRDEAIKYQQKALELAKKQGLPLKEYEEALKKFQE